MSGGDYILGLLAIITGLAISDMIVSLHGLLINRRQVKWDWLPLIAAASVLFLIVSTWRVSFVAFNGATIGPPIWVFVMILAQSVGLYLAARTSLPDNVTTGQHFDLAAYYEGVARYLWSAVALAYFMFIVLRALEPLVIGSQSFPATFFHALVVFPVILGLVAWPSRRFHRLIVPVYFLYLCVRLLPDRLLVT